MSLVLNLQKRPKCRSKAKVVRQFLRCCDLVVYASLQMSEVG